MTTNLFVVANVKQLRIGGSFRILLPFFRKSWHDFGGPSELWGGLNHPTTFPPFGTPLNMNEATHLPLLATLRMPGVTFILRSWLVKETFTSHLKHVRGHCTYIYNYTVMRCLTKGIRSEKCVVRRIRRCANVTEGTYTNLDRIAYYAPSLYGIAYCS